MEIMVLNRRKENIIIKDKGRKLKYCQFDIENE